MNETAESMKTRRDKRIMLALHVTVAHIVLCR